MRILVVDDEPSLREYLELLLTKEGYSVATANGAKSALAVMQHEAFDLVISDMKLGAESGMQVLQGARALASSPEVILITAYGTPAAAVEAMRAGAYDYICKPFDNDELRLLVQKALEKRSIRQENANLRSSLLQETRGMWVGRSDGMRAVFSLVEKVAPSRSTVLITGESGTGKELVARAIHRLSPRADKAFLPINCAALNEGVLESELFGHVKGSFTGAVGDRAGILSSAGEGTVFLDEIGEIPAGTQVKLLRALQERKVKPVGSTAEVPFSARIVAATNKSLDKEVAAGRFREDLLYRLNVITLELPPLRQRKDDIEVLAEHFLEEMRDELQRPGLHFDRATLELLGGYEFPGNVRQLQNIVERAATLADKDLLAPDSLPATLRGERPAETTTPVESPLVPGFSLERYLDDTERRYLLSALKRAEGVKTRAADLLGLSFRSFRYRLAKHGLGDRDEPTS